MRVQDLERLGAAAWCGRRALLSVITCAALASCEQPPIAWQEVRPLPAAAGAPRLALGATAAAPAPSAGMAGEGMATLPPDSAGRQCPGSVRVATGEYTYATWWSVRPDSSALLLAARSDDGGRSWARILPVDTLDRSVRGCARPAPSIAADSVNGYVHVVYFMEAPEGAGIFFSHLMDPRALFEPPAVIVYGERPSAVSVATRGDTVAVAYETPNGARPRVELALSYTAGHLFEHRSVAVSDGNGIAESPSVVLGGQRLTVAWVERPAAGDGPATVVARTGALR
jgi:hypothetical protein